MLPHFTPQMDLAPPSRRITRPFKVSRSTVLEKAKQNRGHWFKHPEKLTTGTISFTGAEGSENFITSSGKISLPTIP